jgi:hypothetical protein
LVSTVIGSAAEIEPVQQIVKLRQPVEQEVIVVPVSAMQVHHVEVVGIGLVHDPGRDEPEIIVGDDVMAACLQHHATILIDDGAGRPSTVTPSSSIRTIERSMWRGMPIGSELAKAQFSASEQYGLALGEDLHATDVGHALDGIEERHPAVQARKCARHGAANEELGVAHPEFACRHADLVANRSRDLLPLSNPNRGKL